MRAIICALLTGAFALPASAATSGAVASTTVFLIVVFVLAVFVGYYVVWSVTPALHTPLMSVTNAISAIVVVGAVIAAAAVSADGDATRETWTARGLGAAAVFFASINIFGGFLVTRRMLAMYRKKS
ncbi:MAG: NAD(P) transhydrogenase subunit alpha [Alphaproteobacteria bacterium]|jgi:NAD(P) transhydrogenase subunit alpha|nr:NAD(P) transhydrogenase subunit alpha [Alphaproteobacteria bacterium]